MNKVRLYVFSFLLFSMFSVYGQDINVKTTPSPVIIQTIPHSGDQAVDPNLTEVKIIFSQDMNIKTMSWVYETKESFPELNGMPQFIDKRTCVAKVKLKPNKTYWIWLNKGEYQSFINEKGKSLLPYLLAFKTKG